MTAKLNAKCPKCGSEYINDRIKRVQGDINVTNSGSSFLFSSSYHNETKAHIDTNEVNKCNDCGHEWKKNSSTYIGTYETTKDLIQYVVWYLEQYHDLVNCEFDPLNIEEQYNSFEEKKSALQKRFDDSWIIPRTRNFWEGI